MNCGRAQELLLDYAENMLSSRRRSTLERHLSKCDCCRMELSTIQGLKEQLLSLRVPEQDAEFWERFGAKLSRRLADEEAPLPRRGFLRPAWVLGAAVATLVVIVSVLAISRGRHDTGSQEGLPTSPEELTGIAFSDTEVGYFETYANGEQMLSLAGLTDEEAEQLSGELPGLIEEEWESAAAEIALDSIYEQGVNDLIDELSDEECEAVYQQLESS